MNEYEIICKGTVVMPVAAYPVTGPIDVVEDGVTGALDQDLERAAHRALAIDPHACRLRAERSGWDACTREFEANLSACRGEVAFPSRPAIEGLSEFS